MMGLGMQDVLVAVVVIAALVYLVRRRWRRSQPQKPEIITLGRAPKRNGPPSPPGPTRGG